MEEVDFFGLTSRDRDSDLESIGGWYIFKGRSRSDQRFCPCYPGLPDFFCYKIPKWWKIYQITTNYTKCP
jgi:hypothetical protein